jgi:hypothetical protein
VNPRANVVEISVPRVLGAGVLLALTTLFAGAAALAQPPGAADADAILRFVRAAEDYALLHRRLEQTVPPIEVNANPETIGRAIDALAAVIRAERRDARPGDLFQPAAQATIRARIAAALRVHGLTPQDVLAAERAEGVDPAAIALHVNDRFPWAISTAMFTCVLEALPPLPAELMYRVVGRDLVLIDAHAGLIVDLLPSAIGEADATACCAGGREVRHGCGRD